MSYTEYYTLDVIDKDIYKNVSKKLKAWEVKFKKKNNTTFEFKDFIHFDTAWKLMIRYEEEYTDFIFKKETFNKE